MHIFNKIKKKILIPLIISNQLKVQIKKKMKMLPLFWEKLKYNKI